MYYEVAPQWLYSAAYRSLGVLQYVPSILLSLCSSSSSNPSSYHDITVPPCTTMLQILQKFKKTFEKQDNHEHGNGIEYTRAGRLLLKCMRTRRSNYPNNSNVTIPRRRRRQVSNIVEPEIRTIVAPMAERTMEELLRAPTEGYGEAIVLPEINADHFEIKTNLLQLVQANPFYGRESENPHAHINSFKRITSTLRFRNVPNDVIKLMMFPYSLEGALLHNLVRGERTTKFNLDLGGSRYQVRESIFPSFENHSLNE
ncbi:hypothetical protein Tco_0890228 [Tanacetum coccineum]|uniref:Reverse transcriptase domain-containing protein n=1 Tax=Tanacetum coccineum TaxID=301880 RepID=A0ABQ5BZV7_9ASTR